MAYQDKYIRNTLTGQSFRFLQTARDTAGQLLEIESAYRAHSSEPTPHYHPIQTEDFTIMVGELTVRINGQVTVFKTGDKIHIPPNTVHSMWNASDTETVVNWQIRPALDTEYFFETVTGLANDGKVGPNGVPPLLQTALLAQQYSSVFRLTKPSLGVQKVVFSLLSPIARLLGYRSMYHQYLN
jgi:mannose-6-phosphate isomerase-like protein (cupin superfamily)